MGRGQWYRWQSKTTTESQLSVDIRWMRRQGYLRPGTSGSLTWSRGGEKTGSIVYRTEQDRLILSYRHKPHGGEWGQIEERILLDATPCNYGGSRPWFLCPHCSRRVAVLYGAGKRFLCRHCYGLAYTSQQESIADRMMRKARRIRARLGGEGNLMEPFPRKPKRMRWQTYWRLREAAQDNEEMGWASALQRFGIRSL